MKYTRRLSLLLFSASLLFGLYFSRRFFEKFIEEIDPYSRYGLILDTPGCKIPKLDPYDESVKHLIVRYKPYVCRGMPVFMITLPNATIVLNETVLKTVYKVPPGNISCSYETIYRQHEPKGSVEEIAFSFGDPRPLQFGVPLGVEFMKVKCIVGKENYTQFIPLVPIKPEIEKTKTENGKSDSLNVILIGIDSISKLNFLRQFKKTYSFLTSNLSAFDMKGYTKVGDNSFPNLVPMLTGHFIEDYWNESASDTMFFDHLDFIWNAYSSQGYRTFYAEDMYYYGTFQYLKRGFENQPTDYYFRPLGLSMRDSDLYKKSTDYCLNTQLEMEIIFGYLKDFLLTMKHKMSFSFTMVSSLTHDDINYAGFADEPTYNLLTHLHSSGITNKSLVVVFSDHGLRFGPIRETYVGKIEERMPILYLAFPKWYLDKHPDINKNLKENQQRLVTLFDLHETLHHVLNTSEHSSEGKENNQSLNGLSLMGEISEYRTCEMAKILPHWCSCHVYQYAPKNDEMAKSVAAAVMSDINRNLAPFKDKCSHLEIENIMDVRLGQANDMVLRFVRHQNDVNERYVVYGDKGHTLMDFLVTLRARPGGGVFEGTVRYDNKYETFKVLGISRINKYGSQSSCMNTQSLKKFCFCK